MTLVDSYLVLKKKVIQLSVQNRQTNLHSSNINDVYKSLKA